MKSVLRKVNIMSKKPLSTFDRFMKKAKQKKRYDEEYKELLLSELFLALMEGDDLSVRKLAKAAGISPTVIQEVKSGKKKNITLETFLKIVAACGWTVVIENPKKKDETKFVLSSGMALA